MKRMTRRALNVSAPLPAEEPTIERRVRTLQRRKGAGSLPDMLDALGLVISDDARAALMTRPFTIRASVEPQFTIEQLDAALAATALEVTDRVGLKETIISVGLVVDAPTAKPKKETSK